MPSQTPARNGAIETMQSDTFTYPDLDIADRIHLQRQYRIHGRSRVMGWLKANIAVPLHGQFSDEFDEEAYYDALFNNYIDTAQ